MGLNHLTAGDLLLSNGRGEFRGAHLPEVAYHDGSFAYRSRPVLNMPRDARLHEIHMAPTRFVLTPDGFQGLGLPLGFEQLAHCWNSGDPPF